MSQEGTPETDGTQRQISRQIGISVASVPNIIRKDLHTKCLNRSRVKQLTDTNKFFRLNRCRQLLKRHPSSIQQGTSSGSQTNLFSPSQFRGMPRMIGTRKCPQEGHSGISFASFILDRPNFTKLLMVSAGVVPIGTGTKGLVARLVPRIGFELLTSG